MNGRRNSELMCVSGRNLDALDRMSGFLLRHSRLIAQEDVDVIADMGVSREDAVRMLLAGACGLDKEERPEDRIMEEQYFRPSLARLSPQEYQQNPYMRLIRFPRAKSGRWEMTRLAYAPYEIFVRDELLRLPDGREIPRLGYFEEEFAYPAVLENGREWMTVTPNEIATMEGAIEQARGDVVAMGLGLGYFALMASEKEDVRTVTIIERDRDVIALVRRQILPQFPQRKKVKILCADAFEFAQRTLPDMAADFVFVDLWHDVSDGAAMYLRMKRLEARCPGKEFVYWIEPSMLAFLRGLALEEWADGKIEAFAGVLNAGMDEEEVRAALRDENLREKAAGLDAQVLGLR